MRGPSSAAQHSIAYQIKGGACDKIDYVGSRCGIQALLLLQSNLVIPKLTDTGLGLLPPGLLCGIGSKILSRTRSRRGSTLDEMEMMVPDGTPALSNLKTAVPTASCADSVAAHESKIVV